MPGNEYFNGFKFIKSADNPSMRLFRRIMSSKKERIRYKLFPLEGLRLVTDALKNNAPVKKIFLPNPLMKNMLQVLMNIV